VSEVHAKARLLLAGAELYVVVGVSSVAVATAYNSHAGVAFLLGVVLFGLINVQHGPTWCAGASVLGAVAVFLAGLWADAAVLLAVVIGLPALLAGSATQWARQSALLAVPMTAAVLSTHATMSTALARALGLLGGALFGAIILKILKIPAPPRGDSLPLNAALLYGGVLGVVTGFATFVVTALELPHGYWLTLTFLAVMQPSIGASRRKTLQRVAGTIVGSGAALFVASVVRAHGAVLALGLAFAIGSAVLSTDYRWRTALLTIGVVLLVEGSTSAESAIEVRIVLTLAGSLIVLALCYLVPAMVHVVESEVHPTHDSD
jgi:hypothetical protein